MGFEGSFNVSLIGNFGGYSHTGFGFHALEPFEAFFTHAFKSAWLGARLPDASAIDLYAAGSKLLGS